MEFVLDAPVALAWCYEDESTTESEELFDALNDGHAVAPGIWLFEIMNSLVQARKRDRIPESKMHQFLGMLRATGIEVVAFPHLESAIAIAEQHGLSAYDAAYLDLAEARGLPLATRDERLRAAAVAAGIEVLAA